MEAARRVIMQRKRTLFVMILSAIFVVVLWGYNCIYLYKNKNLDIAFICAICFLSISIVSFVLICGSAFQIVFPILMVLSSLFVLSSVIFEYIGLQQMTSGFTFNDIWILFVLVEVLSSMSLVHLWVKSYRSPEHSIYE